MKTLDIPIQYLLINASYNLLTDLGRNHSRISFTDFYVFFFYKGIWVSFIFYRLNFVFCLWNFVWYYPLMTFSNVFLIDWSISEISVWFLFSVSFLAAFSLFKLQIISFTLVASCLCPELISLSVYLGPLYGRTQVFFWHFRRLIIFVFLIRCQPWGGGGVCHSGMLSWFLLFLLLCLYVIWDVCVLQILVFPRCFCLSWWIVFAWSYLCSGESWHSWHFTVLRVSETTRVLVGENIVYGIFVSEWRVSAFK